DHHGREESAVERHPAIAKYQWVDDDYVRHREEGRKARERLNAGVRPQLTELEGRLEPIVHLGSYELLWSGPGCTALRSRGEGNTYPGDAHAVLTFRPLTA